MPRIALVLSSALVLSQAPPADRPPEMAVLKAGLGDCSADFTVKDAGGAPLYGATIQVRVRYGMWGVKRADLEVGTNSDGRARIEGLPRKARPLNYSIEKDGAKAAADQDVSRNCHARYDISLK